MNWVLIKINQELFDLFKSDDLLLKEWFLYELSSDKN